MIDINSWKSPDKEIAQAFFEKWKDELDDVNYLDGIVFAVEYLKSKGMLRDEECGYVYGEYIELVDISQQSKETQDFYKKYGKKMKLDKKYLDKLQK